MEIMHAFQYDQNHFFSLAMITFKPGCIDGWHAILEQDLRVVFVQELSRLNECITCIIQSTSAIGFFPLPVPQQGSWAIMPPIIMDPRAITLTLIAEEPVLSGIHATLSSMGIEITILALDDLVRGIQGFQGIPNPLPSFTDRQREVATYAVRNGYFKHPKQVSAAAIAARFKISISAVNEHLRKARVTAMTFLFG
jgi:DNA-binding CsgD family transcriptional regulator